MNEVAAKSEIVLSGKAGPRFDEVLTPAALEFLADLHRRFDERRRDLIDARQERQERYDAGELPNFRIDTEEIRNGDWTVAPMPEELSDRRVELTGPVDRKHLVEGLNAGARVYMGDFEDGTSPTWSNMVEGQLNILDYWQGRLGYVDPDTGRELKVSETPAILMTRPRGWRLPEEHLHIDGAPISGSLFDFGLTAFHNAANMLARGTRPYFYLAKLEGHLEARLWNDVFDHAEKVLKLPPRTIKATVHIETLPAAFEMHEILHELREHSVGLNTGRWDYIFSLIKTFQKRAAYLLPDRDQMDMGGGFLKACSELVVQTCHRRGTFAMGSMSAYIPTEEDSSANRKAFDDIRRDKTREVEAGHDGTWVAHPALVPIAKEVFDRHMPGPNQLDRQRPDLDISQFDLLEVHDGIRTEQGLRHNIRHGVQYLEAWLRGEGSVPLDNVMEDLAISEISRGQIWQQLRFHASLAEGSKATPALFGQFLTEEMERVKEEIGEEAYQAGRFADAIALFTELSMAEELQPSLTLAAYRLIA